MLRDALDAFVRRDTELAQQVLNEDDALDALKTQIFRELLTYMLQDPATIEPALDLILVSRHLERIGDHATNIAEDVIFMVSARDVRHHAARAARVAAQSRAAPSGDPACIPRVRNYADTIRWIGCATPLCVFCRRHPVDPAWRPFCSERCKMEDLARWADGRLPRSRRAPARRRRTPTPTTTDNRGSDG